MLNINFNQLSLFIHNGRRLPVCVLIRKLRHCTLWTIMRQDGDIKTILYNWWAVLQFSIYCRTRPLVSERVLYIRIRRRYPDTSWIHVTQRKPTVSIGRSQWSTKYKIQNSCFVPLTWILDCSGVQKTKNKKKVDFLFCQGTKQAPCDKILEFFCTSIVQVHN